jgi:hypothetical protein
MEAVSGKRYAKFSKEGGTLSVVVRKSMLFRDTRTSPSPRIVKPDLPKI